ncbi:MAG TPA: ATP-binding protein, partial [Polyangiaceae bacterium]|nr:ATP-binding protein [Polyangiaceae bacterium]
LSAYEGLTFLSGPSPWTPEGALGGRAFVRAELPRPSAAEQAALWARQLGDELAPGADLGALTGAFRLTGGQIRDAAEGARALARMREGGEGHAGVEGRADGEGREGGEGHAGGEGRVDAAALADACRQRHGRKLAALARRVVRRGGWDDLVLPADRKAALREIALQLRHRSRVLGDWGFGPKLGAGTALSALFSGPPGTGKTMAASIVAAELGVELYHVDLSQVVSKYIGETEKHLAELFADAEAASACSTTWAPRSARPAAAPAAACARCSPARAAPARPSPSASSPPSWGWTSTASTSRRWSTSTSARRRRT